MSQSKQSGRKPSLQAAAFTLVEMLVVISIIGILAALIIGVLPAVTRSKVHSRVRTELTAIETVIDGYKQKKGFYPPGVNTNRPTLYYELTGQAMPDYATNFFGVVGVANSGADDSYNFFRNVRASQLITNYVGNDPTKPVILLGIQTKAADGGPAAVLHYDASSGDRHNHESFDLSADVMVNGKPETIGNWRD